MGKKIYTVWRLDPAKKAMARLPLDAGKKDFALTIQKMCRASALGHRFVCDVDGVKMFVAADAGAEEGQPGFRFRGVNGITAGIGVLFGQGDGGGLTTVPADRGWLERHVVWTAPEETDEEAVGEDA